MNVRGPMVVLAVYSFVFMRGGAFGSGIIRCFQFARRQLLVQMGMIIAHLDVWFWARVVVQLFGVTRHWVCIAI